MTLTLGEPENAAAAAPVAPTETPVAVDPAPEAPMAAPDAADPAPETATAAPTAVDPAPTAPATKPKKARRAEVSPDDLRRLAARIEEMKDTRLPELLDELRENEGMVLAQKGTATVVSMAGIAATSEAGRHMALSNWANAARRTATVRSATVAKAD